MKWTSIPWILPTHQFVNDGGLDIRRATLETFAFAALALVGKSRGRDQDRLDCCCAKIKTKDKLCRHSFNQTQLNKFPPSAGQEAMIGHLPFEDSHSHFRNN